MAMNQEDFEAIDRALVQQMKNGHITERCPRCNGHLVYIQEGNSFEVKCETANCIEEIFRGI